MGTLGQRRVALLDAGIGREGGRKARAGLAVILVFVTVSLAGCASPHARPLVRDEEREGWPPRMADRELREVTAQYVLYAPVPAAADELQPWLDKELDALSKRGLQTDGPGVVLAIEAGAEPVPAVVEQWRQANISRARQIDWAGSRERVQTKDGRPYSLSYHPWFAESFVMPADVARRIGVLPDDTPMAAWVSWLTTTQYVEQAFDETMAEKNRQRDRLVSEDAATRTIPLGEWVFGMSLRLDLAMGTPRLREVDCDLAKLQRCETLAQAVISASGLDPDRRAAELDDLTKRIDGCWQKVYFSRPLID